MVEQVEDLRKMIGALLDREASRDSRVFELFKQQIDKREAIPSKEDCEGIIQWCFDTVRTMDAYSHK